MECKTSPEIVVEDNNSDSYDVNSYDNLAFQIDGREDILYDDVTGVHDVTLSIPTSLEMTGTHKSRTSQSVPLVSASETTTNENNQQNNNNRNSPGIPTKDESPLWSLPNPPDSMEATFIHIHTKKRKFRGQKMYITKDKWHAGNWKKCICCCTIALAFVLVLGIIAVAGIPIFLAAGAIAAGEEGNNGDHKSTTPTMTAEIPANNNLPVITTTTSSSQAKPNRGQSYYVPNALDLELRLLNISYKPVYADPASEEFTIFAESLERELMYVLFPDTFRSYENIHLKVTQLRLRSNTVVAHCRLGWVDTDQFLDIDQLSLARRFTFYLNTYGEYIGNIQVHRGALKSYRLMDACQFGNGGCSHSCHFSLQRLDFVCLCPQEMILSLDDPRTCVNSHSSQELPSFSTEFDTEVNTVITDNSDDLTTLFNFNITADVPTAEEEENIEIDEVMSQLPTNKTQLIDKNITGVNNITESTLEDFS